MKNIKAYRTHLKAALSILAILALGLSSSSKTAAIQNRAVRVVGADAIAGQPFSISVQLDAQGNENAVGFSLNYDPAIFTDPVVMPGAGASGAMLTSQTGSGQVGVSLTYPPGSTFAAGTQQLVSVTFNVVPTAPVGQTQITFGDSPTPSTVSDGTTTLPADFFGSTINVLQPNPRPTLISLNPSSVPAGSNGFNLTITGTNFVPGPGGSVARFNGAPKNTSFVSSSQLLVVVQASDINTPGMINVTVVNPPPNGGTSNTLTLSVTGAAQTITSISPNSATVGSSDVKITITGTGFVGNSVARFNGTDLATMFGSDTQLTATIPASNLTTAGTANITVFNPGGGVSNAVTFTINAVSLAITTLSPASATAGGAMFTLTVNGTAFVNGATVRFNGNSRMTMFGSSTQLTAQILATDIATAGTAMVTVVNPDPGGGTSNAVSFPINTAQPLMLSSLSPRFAIVGGPMFMLTVTGTGFTSASVVQVNDTPRMTTFGSATQLTAAIPATDIATQGMLNIKVVTTGGGTSNTLPFVVGAQLSSVSAASYTGPNVASGAILAGFGVNLATQMQSANSVPLPTNMAGTQIRVTDSAGTARAAGQFYVSPGQLNYLLPMETANGEALVVATSSDNKISVGTVRASSVEPGIFTASANGLGPAAAVILRVQGGQQTFEPMVRFDTATNAFVGIPVDVSPANGQVFLVLFGTGFRNRSALSAVSATIGGTASTLINFAGPVDKLVGLDQTNVLIPPSLAGRGSVDVIMMVDGKTTNTVKMTIK